MLADLKVIDKMTLVASGLFWRIHGDLNRTLYQPIKDW